MKGLMGLLDPSLDHLGFCKLQMKDFSFYSNHLPSGHPGLHPPFSSEKEPGLPQVAGLFLLSFFESFSFYWVDIYLSPILPRVLFLLLVFLPIHSPRELLVNPGSYFKFTLNLSSPYPPWCSAFLTNLATLPQKGFANTGHEFDSQRR